MNAPHPPPGESSAGPRTGASTVAQQQFEFTTGPACGREQQRFVVATETAPNDGSSTAGAELYPDRAMAERHLTLVDERASRFTFQTFDDNQNRRYAALARVLHGTLEEHWSTLVALNRAGAGVFVTVNATDFQGRTNGHIQRARAVFQEADRPGTPMPPLDPHLVVESSPGKFHRYVLTATSDFGAWRGVQRRLASDYGEHGRAV